MGGGSRGSSSTSTQEIPAELKPLYSQTGTKVMGLQEEAPISTYLTPRPAEIAPLSPTQQTSLDLLNRNLMEVGQPLEEAPIVGAGKRYFESQVAPGIENRATLSGLGRSTALENARATAEAATVLPIMQGEQARRDSMIEAGLRGGDIERAVEQDTLTAEMEDYLRSRALAEKALFAPVSDIPSTFGQATRGRESGGGMFKILPWLFLLGALWI